jgi:hypothetical protein
MKRLAALTLTFAFLGTGCIIDADDDDFAVGDYADTVVYWEFVRHAPAQTGGEVLYDPYDVPLQSGNTVCAESDVDTVEVTTPVESFVFDCVYAGVQGATLQAMPRGTHNYTITGWRGNVAAYRSTVAITVDANGELNPVAVEGVSAPIDLFAYFRFGPGGDGRYGTPDDGLYTTCDEATRPDVLFDVYDSFGTLIVSDDAGCPTGMRADPLAVFADALDLDRYDVRMAGYNASQQLVFDSCTQTFDHFDVNGQTDAGGVAITLDNPVPSCQ